MARILIIDDEAGIRRVIKLFLEKEGHEVIEASEGNSGLDLQRRHLADMVITDLVMPDREGFEVIVRLRRDYPKTAIIAVSGGGMLGQEDYLLKARELGADATLQKPFTRKDLLETVASLLLKRS
jgi:DNA-binding response OmpR family regulator